MRRRAHTGELMWPRLFRRFDGGARTLQGQFDAGVRLIARELKAMAAARPS